MAAFLVAAVVSGFSAYTYIKVSNKYPSAGGIAMILKKAYGPTTVTGAAALLAVGIGAAVAETGPLAEAASRPFGLVSAISTRRSRRRPP